jgi:hypothetical protein
VALGVAGRDQAAHRVPHHDHGEVAAHLADDFVEVVHEPLEVLDQRGLALRAAVAHVVGADHLRAARDQRLGDMLIAADVLAVAVHQHDQPGGAGGRPAAHLHAADRRLLAHDVRLKREQSLTRTSQTAHSGAGACRP